MAVRHSPVQVSIGDGSLKIGKERYPLQTISHFGLRRKDPPRQERPSWRNVLVYFLLAALGISFLPVLLDGWGLLVLVMCLIIGFHRVPKPQTPPTLHGLVINTAGTQQDIVWSTDEREIDQVMAALDHAISTPGLSTTVVNVFHAVDGDLIQQYGEGSVGKQSHFGFGDNVVGG
ncbi:DUF6232 family protein [Streptosporangium saharense]|uniref:DUF6232 family protein n=1 Tax=Streptosporangium saharense TaxID=1706840 RepID=UPI0036CD4679